MVTGGQNAKTLQHLQNVPVNVWQPGWEKESDPSRAHARPVARPRLRGRDNSLIRWLRQPEAATAAKRLLSYCLMLRQPVLIDTVRTFPWNASIIGTNNHD